FGALAAGALFGPQLAAGEPGAHAGNNPPKATHFPAKATSVIFLFMDGGVSQVDSFDPKPLLTQENGKPFKMKMEPTQFNNNGNTLGSPWAFKNYGQSGLPISALFPHIGGCADDLTIIRSLVSEFPEHTSANYFVHTGSGLQGRPSMGAWASYGLGSRCADLPGFIVLNGGLIPPGGLDCFGNGFLPATFQSSIFRATAQPVANVRPSERTPQLQRDKLALTRDLDQGLLARVGAQDALASAIANAEMAFAMQTSVPQLMDLSGESAATRTLYGLDSQYEHTRSYAAQCLVARRLVERGVRFIELTCPPCSGDRWDQHSALKQGHEDNARAVDQPIAGLLTDLKARGLLDSTLVVFTGEFGRTPFAQGSDGRDHNPFAFSGWLAGGGVKGGHIHGATDEYGYKVVQDKVDVHDLHATMLHLMGMDHKRVTYRYGGRDMRLTDVHGEVVKGILA
ncbi:MAG: DUF1501 domain-containing protein, partial [Planctomycetes bacterium]|nr:DUF1501 domain-containing protein [Planctomycetota bacterium]